MADRCEIAVRRGGIRSAVMYGVADFDACWPAIENDSTNFLLQDRDQILVVKKILLRAVNRRRQMSIKPTSELHHLFD